MTLSELIVYANINGMAKSNRSFDDHMYGIVISTHLVDLEIIYMKDGDRMEMSHAYIFEVVPGEKFGKNYTERDFNQVVTVFERMI